MVIFAQEAVKLIIDVVGISLGKSSWADITAGEYVVVFHFDRLSFLNLKFLNQTRHTGG